MSCCKRCVSIWVQLVLGVGAVRVWCVVSVVAPPSEVACGGAVMSGLEAIDVTQQLLRVGGVLWRE